MTTVWGKLFQLRTLRLMGPGSVLNRQLLALLGLVISKEMPLTGRLHFFGSREVSMCVQSRVWQSYFGFVC